MEDLHHEQEGGQSTPDSGNESFVAKLNQELEQTYGLKKDFRSDLAVGSSLGHAKAKFGEELGEVDDGDVASVAKALAKAHQLFSDAGRQEAKQKPAQSKQKSEKSVYDVVEFFSSNPEAREVWDQVKEAAENVGKDPIELYKSSTYFQGEAKTLSRQKKEAGEASASVSSPIPPISSGKKIDFSKVDANNREHMRAIRESGQTSEYHAWVRRSFKNGTL